MEEKQFEERPLGFLGNLFIEERMRISSFNDAFDDWKKFEHTMEFILRYPMVADYNKYDEHRKERRQDLRKLAKSWFGDHIRSADVEVLTWIMQAFQCFGVMPRRRREFGRDEIISIFEQFPELEVDTLSDDAVDYLASDFTHFVLEHNLSHVAEPTMGLLYLRHKRAIIDAEAENKRGDDQQDALR